MKLCMWPQRREGVLEADARKADILRRDLALAKARIEELEKVRENVWGCMEYGANYLDTVVPGKAPAEMLDWREAVDLDGRDWL